MPYYAILGKLNARTAIHIGTGEDNDVTDELCRRDVQGNFIIPGTAIGGALRAIATRIAPRLGSPICRALRDSNQSNSETDEPCGCWVCHLFGEINPGRGETETEGGRASRIIVAHAKLILPEDKMPHIRDSVGMDRLSKTASRAGGVKFDLEVLPAGSEAELRLELEDVNKNDLQLLAVTLAEWKAHRAWLGGRVARGLGAFNLKEIHFVSRYLSHAETLINFLKTDTPWKNASANENWLENRIKEARNHIQDVADEQNIIAHSFISIQFDLTFEASYLSNDTAAAVRSGFDFAPLLDIMSPEGQPILTGASLRGALRSHAERIARTMTTLNVNNPDDFLKKCPACNPVASGNEEAPLSNCDTLLRNVANVPDEQEVSDEQLCFACRLFGSTRKGSRLIVEDARANSETLRKVLDFVAIDRFTGGGKEGAKFDALALWQPVFPVRLYLENPTEWELGWLYLLLRDLQDGMLTFGLGAAKGFGRAKITSIVVKHGFISDRDFAGPTELVPQNALENSGLYRLISWKFDDNEQRQQFQRIAQDWLNAFKNVIESFERSEELRLKNDSYFNGTIPTFYEKEAYQCLTKQ